MTALTGDRNAPARDGVTLSLGVAAAKTIYAGALVAVDAAGNATPGATAADLSGVGRADEQVDNSTGSAGDVLVRVRMGIFRFANSAAGDAITTASIGQACYIVDDQTVAKTSGGGTRSPAGFVVDVDAQGVWVRLGLIAHPAGGLLAANNFSDVANAATARGNLGVNKIYLPLSVADLVGANAAVYRLLAPVTGTITSIHSVLDAALATGNATLTAKIDGVAVTGGVATITEAGSAAGDVDSAAPSAANAVTAGTSVISITVGGTNTASVGASALIELTY